MNPSIPKPVTVLYLGSLTHSDDTSFLDRTRPHEDQIDFQAPVKLSMIRIPRPGKDIYSKHISITQTQSIKNFEIYYRNLEKTTGRYSLLMSTNELMVNQNDDILITPKQPIFTDLLLFKGNFTKITLCIYGNLIRDEYFLSQKCPNFGVNAAIEPMNQSLMQMYGKINAYSKKDVFEQKREMIHQIESEIMGSDSIEDWPQVVNDDGINEQQIENICNLSQKLLTTYNNQQLTQEIFVVQFRAGLQDISANLAKIFKNKHLGLYYPSFEDSTISNDLSLSITKLALYSLDLSLSEQVRGLEILKFILQLDRHTQFFIEHYGVEKLMKIFVDFFKINSVVLSTCKNLCLEVLISVSHWKKAAIKMTQTINNAFYHEIFEEKILQPQKVPEERERSRQKKVSKKSRSESQSSESDGNNKKKKKDKQKKRNKSRQKKKTKQTKQQALDKPAEEKEEIGKILSLRDEIPNISFYEILLFYLAREKSCKELILVKILLEQILQTMKKNKIVSERVALSTSLLKDLKYIFNPAGQVLNTKSLKQFASCYQPFLNSVQSEGVDSEIVAEQQKLKHMRKYGIDPKVCKILNRISMEIASSECEQNEDETRTPFTSSFIVMVSELIRSRQPTVLYGFGRLLSSFRQVSSRDIIHLKRVEAAMTMISEYIYKVLLEDDGLFTVLNIDQIYTALINISNCLSKDQSAFTKELKRKIRQLTNYAMAYDLFTSSQGNFKTISEYFLRLFKFEHYEINKISDYKKKQFDKATNPLSIGNLSNFYGLGSFHELFPEQPLLEIDVYLKIFNIVLQYNKNSWPLFYENKLICGFSVLFTRLSNLITFLLGSGVERECGLRNVRKVCQTVENYLNVMLRLILILTKKAEYEAAFNDLLDEDHFENVEVYERSFSLYVSLFNAINSSSSLLSSACKKLAQQIIAKILLIYDKLLQSYELTTHQSRQSKIKEIWIMIYETHFTNLKSRAACLSLFAFFAQTLESNTMKLFNTVCLEESLKMQTNFCSKNKGHIPRNQKSIIQNLIHANIYRNDPLIIVNLALLIKNLVDKHSEKNPIVQKVTAILENIFDKIDSNLKEKGTTFESSKDLLLLEKLVLFTEILKRLNCTLTIKFEEKLLKHLKYIESIKRDYIEENKSQQKAYKLSLNIKINIILFLKKSFSQKPQNPQFLTLIQILAKTLDVPTKLTKFIQEKSQQDLSSAEMQIEKQILRLVNSSMDVICACSSNPFNQSVILYEIFMEKPYKPAPQLSLIHLFSKLTSGYFLKFMTSPDNEMMLENSNQSSIHSNVQNLQKSLKKIAIRMVYFLCLLTTIDSKDFYSTQSRRNAITCLITDDKDFPLSKLQILKPILPSELIQTLKDYFAYPIVEKPLTIKTQEKKQTLKNKGYLFSKALFSIIMQGEPTAKSRYLYIGGPWKSGDLSTNFLYAPSRQRNYSKTVSKSLTTNQIKPQIFDLHFFNTFTASKTEILEPQLIEFNIKKRNKVIEKKQSVETQIKLVNIPLVLENLGPKIDQNASVKRVSPSPSNKTGYGKVSQAYDNRVRMSPSPPSNKTTGQNIIGFNTMNQSAPQYSSQTLSNMGFTSNIQTNNPVQAPIVPGQGISPQVSMTGVSGYDQTGALKNMPYERYQQEPNPVTQRPVYPNPYYSTNPIQKQPSLQKQNPPPPVGAMPYMEMQKVNSQESSGQMRSGSNSAPRSNVPYGTGMGYQAQQPYYASNQPYVNPGHKYDNRSHSPYQHNKPYSQNYGNQRSHQGGYYSGPQDRNMGSGYGGYGEQMMSNNPRMGGYQSQQMGNRPQNNGQYNKYDYQSRNQPPVGQNYPPTMASNYPPSNYSPSSNYNQESQQDERLYNDAILLVTELRGVLPQHLKNDKKSRLHQIILQSNLRVQNRIKEYMSTLK